MSDNGKGLPAGLRILVVEDHADTALTTAVLLRLYGHEVAVAPDGPAALAAAQACWPDVVLLDIGLPRMDGYAVARWFQDQADRKPPLLIAVTGYGQPEDRRRSQEAGIHEHLLKPVDYIQLQPMLEQVRGLLRPDPP
jgi:CheY-like chemotaxis protein